MIVVGLELIAHFGLEYPDCAPELAEFVREIEASDFHEPLEFVPRYPTSERCGETIVFKLTSDRYRLTAVPAYNCQVFVVLSIETLADYKRRRGAKN